jgi:hypothetical protein
VWLFKFIINLLFFFGPRVAAKPTESIEEMNQTKTFQNWFSTLVTFNMRKWYFLIAAILLVIFNNRSLRKTSSSRPKIEDFPANFDPVENFVSGKETQISPVTTTSDSINLRHSPNPNDDIDKKIPVRRYI